ncbi:hypothetical protein RIF29_22807 [Crotalaria pallida]|uniref:Gnk2-homologous domain-containing protein n=1 Tax=Crotalaria pallida TaxID=3830 RepID=A0AAN9I8A1_CROPI
MGSFGLLLLLLTFFSHFIPCFSSPIIIEAAIHQHPHAFYNCTNNATSAANSAYRSNIRALIDIISSNGTGNPISYNTTVANKKIAYPISYSTTVASKNTADTVYGFFGCKSGLTIKMCQECLIEAGKLILSLCTKAKEAIVWRDECFVRYSDFCFFSTVEESPKLTFADDHNYEGHVGRFSIILKQLMNDLIAMAASDSNKYSYKTANITEDEKSYMALLFVPHTYPLRTAAGASAMPLQKLQLFAAEEDQEEQ